MACYLGGCSSTMDWTTAFCVRIPYLNTFRYLQHYKIKVINIGKSSKHYSSLYVDP